MEQERIAVLDLADELHVRKQRLFKVIKKLGIHATMRQEPTRGGQRIAVVTAAEAARIRVELQQRSNKRRTPLEQTSEQPRYEVGDEVGVFYVVQLEPQHDCTRFKVGFTADMESRLRKHRTTAAFARCEKTWPCRRKWEGTAVDCVTEGCEQLREEVFRGSSLVDVIRLADEFFSVMPRISLKAREKEQAG